jgi:hypothetical protein
VRRDGIRVLAYCGLGESPVIWNERETLDAAVTRGVRKLYMQRRAQVGGDWRIIHTDAQAVEIESPVHDSSWSEIGVIRCRLNRTDGGLDRWFRRVR